MPIGLFTDTLLPQGESTDTDVASICDYIRYATELSDIVNYISDALYQLQASTNKLSLSIQSPWPTGDTFDVYGPDGSLYTQLSQTGLYTQGIITAISIQFADYTLTVSDHTIIADTTSNDITLTLPLAPVPGEIHSFKKPLAAHTLTISGNGANIDLSPTKSLTSALSTLTIQFDGADWWILSQL